jgi:hypothetical protein
MKRALAVLLVAGSAVALTTSADAAGVRPIPGTSCPAFPADNVWHADVSKLPVNARSAAWLSHMSPRTRLHPDFGPSYGEHPVPYGIPITVVGGKHRRTKVRFGSADESDRVRYPLGKDTKVEGGRWRDGDRHTIVVDKAHCRLYETWATSKSSSGWRAGSGAVWDLRSNNLRPAGWTSADAAGLPILPGLLRYDEVRAGRVDHAIRFTTDVTDRRFIWPARHQAGSVNNASYPPMGARFRLRAGFDMSGLRADTRTVLRAMQTYGLILADNGSPWYFQGTADNRWPEALLDQLKDIPASAFEAVDESSLMVGQNSGKAR